MCIANSACIATCHSIRKNEIRSDDEVRMLNNMQLNYSYVCDIDFTVLEQSLKYVYACVLHVYVHVISICYIPLITKVGDVIQLHLQCVHS